jgi:hypothetical protein
MLFAAGIVPSPDAEVGWIALLFLVYIKGFGFNRTDIFGENVVLNSPTFNDEFISIFLMSEAISAFPLAIFQISVERRIEKMLFFNNNYFCRYHE